MLAVPYELLRCSWPQAATCKEQTWTSEPEWSAPTMPYAPRPSWQWLRDQLCWTIDWCDFFSQGVHTRRGRPGEMRGFQVVFDICIARDGELVFWDDDGCIVRRRGRVIHSDRRAHRLRRHSITVRAGDRLEIAQWQKRGGWLWGARLDNSDSLASCDPADALTSYAPRVMQRLRNPNGPTLKVFTHGRSPLRLALAIYSCILHGYAPPRVQLFGEHQWSEPTRDFIRRTLPFAEVVPTEAVINRLYALGQPTLARRAVERWYIMKACVSLLYPPGECCCMDDDVFILDCLDDALAAFETNDLVYAPDMDHADGYRATWPHLIRDEFPLSTAHFNAGLYWVRGDNPGAVAAAAAQTPPSRPHFWEQGLIAATYARRPNRELSGRRYFYPVFDGLPGGLHGYDYAGNPCRFASIHFGALREKPNDADAAALLRDILAERRAEVVL